MMSDKYLNAVNLKFPSSSVPLRIGELASRQDVEQVFSSLPQLFQTTQNILTSLEGNVFSPNTIQDTGRLTFGLDTFHSFNSQEDSYIIKYRTQLEYIIPLKELSEPLFENALYRVYGDQASLRIPPMFIDIGTLNSGSDGLWLHVETEELYAIDQTLQMSQSLFPLHRTLEKLFETITWEAWDNEL